MNNKTIPAVGYVVVWGLLMAGFGLSLGLSHFYLKGFNVPVAIFIAFCQMMLVIIYFMHVRYSPRLTWLFVASGFYWFGILFILSLSDYLSRGWLRR